MEKIRDGESKKREDAGARKGREVAKYRVFPMFCGSGGSKSRGWEMMNIFEIRSWVPHKPEGKQL